MMIIYALALLFYILSYSISATFRDLQVEIRSQLLSTLVTLYTVGLLVFSVGHLRYSKAN